MRSENTAPCLRAPDPIFSLSIQEKDQVVEMPFSDDTNLLIEVEELKEALGFQSALQAELLPNLDQSCWLTNLGRSGSIEVFSPARKKHKCLAENQVVHLKDGDYVGFFGSFFQVVFSDESIQWIPTAKEQWSLTPDYTR